MFSALVYSEPLNILPQSPANAHELQYGRDGEPDDVSPPDSARPHMGAEGEQQAERSGNSPEGTEMQ